MFLPNLLAAYDQSLSNAGSPALYEKITPILYWRPRIDGDAMIETTMGGRRPVVEVKAKIDFGRDVVACNLMTEDKEVWKLDRETLHRNYICPESGINEVPLPAAVNS